MDKIYHHYALEIPDFDDDLSLNRGDHLIIVIEENCNWSWSGPDDAFSPKLLAPGTYTATDPPTFYGPYKAAKTGEVTYSATENDCGDEPILTAHSIVVS